MKVLFAAPLSGVRTSIFISEYYMSLARAATGLGHNTRLHDTNEIIASSNISPMVRKFYRPFAGVVERLHLLSFFEKNLRRDLLETVEGFCPDVLFIYVINAQSLAPIIKEIRSRGVVVVMWVGLNPQVLSPGAKSVLPELDCVFCYDPTYLDFYASIGCRRVEVVPMGVDIDRFDSVDQASNVEAIDVSFVGMIDDTRRRLLGSLQNVNLGIWSWNVDPDDSLLMPFFKGEASSDLAIKILKSSRISINIHRDFERSGGNFRLFEIPASGALQLVDNKPMISSYFIPGQEIITFDSSEDLQEKIDYFLAHEEERKKIVERARLRLEREHGIVDRFRRMEQVFSKL